MLVQTRNVYYPDPAKFDLSKMRAEAALRARGDQLNEPMSTVIHWHSHEVPCDYPNDPAKGDHQEFAAIFGEEK